MAIAMDEKLGRVLIKVLIIPRTIPTRCHFKSSNSDFGHFAGFASH